MSKPSFHVYEQLPIAAWRDIWSRREIDDAIRLHELGQFQQAAMLAETMTRDDAVDAVLDVRGLGILSLAKKVEPSTEQRKGAGGVAKRVEDAWDTMFPRAQLATMLRWRYLLGFALAQITWEANEDGTEWMPRIEPWHPLYTYYRLDRRCYVAYTTEGPVEITPSDGQWLLYAPGGDRSWMTGAVRSIARPWKIRQDALTDWARWSEVYSLGIRKAFVPPNAAAGKKKAFFAGVKALGNETTILLEKGQNEGDPTFDLEVVYPDSSTAAEGFNKLLDKCESRIAIRVLGQNLTTDVKGGSFAAAKVHENVKADLIEADARTLAECLREQLLKPWAAYHFSQGAGVAPIIGWDTTPPEDKKATADAMLSLADALTKLQAVAPIDSRAMLEAAGVPLLAETDDDEKAKGQIYQYHLQFGIVSINEARAALGLPPIEGGDVAPKPSSEGGGGDGAAPDTSTLSQPITAAQVLAAKPRRTNAIAGQLYVDAVADQARDAATVTLASLTDEVQSIVAGASSYDEIRARLLALYKDTDPTELAAVVEGALVLSDLAGRHAVNQDAQ